MRGIIKASFAMVVIAASFAVPVPTSAAKPHASVAACATDASFHPDGVFFVKQCVRLRSDGTCVRYRVITCGGK